MTQKDLIENWTRKPIEYLFRYIEYKLTKPDHPYLLFGTYEQYVDYVTSRGRILFVACPQIQDTHSLVLTRLEKQDRIQIRPLGTFPLEQAQTIHDLRLTEERITIVYVLDFEAANQIRSAMGDSFFRRICGSYIDRCVFFAIE